jgi:hypothetical protein
MKSTVGSITIILKGERVMVNRDDYVTAKWKDLRMHFHTLDKKTVDDQLELILTHRAVTHPIIASYLTDDKPELPSTQ